MSAEAKAFEAEVLAPASQNPSSTATSIARNDGCVDVKGVISYYWEDGDTWITLTIEFTDCDSGGGGDVFAWVIDNGYEDPPHVVVDANKYDIVGLDSVVFTAEVVSNVHLSAIGWTWVPTGGGSWDPWTQACSGTSTTCKIQVHGDGKMYYTVQDQLGFNLTSYVHVGATLPDDIDPNGEGQGDAELPSGWDMGGSSSADISVSDGQLILLNAISQPEWHYTQGCDKCGSFPRPYTEPAIDIPNRYGDCTDFTQTVIKQYLGSQWTHQKLSTTMFNTFSVSQLAAHGYSLVDSANAREGDVVLRARATNGVADSSGHVGIFAGWFAGGHPIGWANNGLPARHDRPNVDNATGPFDFVKVNGWATKFFRPRR